MDCVVNKIINNIELGNIKVRSMFGAKMIFSNDIPFCMVFESEVYIRASEQCKKIFIELGSEPLIFEHPHKKVKTRYYKIPSKYLDDINMIRSFTYQAYSRYLTDFSNSPQRIRDLPNMKQRHERLLATIGIRTVEEFKLIGAKQAFRRLKLKNEDVTEDLLYKFFGAIEGKNYLVIKNDKNYLIKK